MRFHCLSKTKHFVICLAVHAATTLLFGHAVMAQVASNEASITASANADFLVKHLFELLESNVSAGMGFAGNHGQLDEMAVGLYMNSMAPYWVSNQGPVPKAATLLSYLKKSEEEGLDPARYQIGQISGLLDRRDAQGLARLDAMLTLALIAYVTDLREGRAASCLSDPSLFAAARNGEENIPQLIREGLAVPDLAKFLSMLPPQHADYRALKRLLAEYRLLEAKGGWPRIPEGKKIELGMPDDRLDLLAQRLLITNDLPALPPPVFAQPLPDPTLLAQQPFESAPALVEPGPPVRIYDEELVKAVRRFQFRYNLEQDGIVGKTTLAALNIPVQDHVNKIILNMERWRWLPHRLDSRRILVNIAGFSLTGMNNEQPEISMPVIVGEVYHKTPVFSQAMSYIEVNPYWTVPPSIARNEIVEKMQKDPGYLKKERIRIFAGWEENAPEIHPADINWHAIGAEINRYRLRQDPGPENALGTIKFMFPNSSNIYMHDTPSQGLFRRAKRSFSHGCIRVSRPLDLAWYILQHDGQAISKEHVKKQIASGKQKVFILKQPLPVHIIYLTAQVDQKEGTVHFYDDIYDHDVLLAKALLAGNQQTDGFRYSYR